MPQIFSRRFRRSNVRTHQIRPASGKKSVLDASPTIEMLEGRVFLSISTSLLAGPFKTAGNEFTYDSVSTASTPPTIVGTFTETVKPQATDPDNNLAAVAIDSTSFDGAGNPISTGISYTAPGDTVADYGNTTSNIDGTTIVKDTFSPAELTLPASLTQQVPFGGAGNPITETEVITRNGVPGTATITTIELTGVLVSETPAQLVTPLGTTFPTTFEVDLTEIDTPQGGIAGAPSTTREWFAPHKGLVMSENADPSSTNETELASFNGDGGGGAGTGLTPAIVASTVPSAVVGGAKLHGALKLSLTDSLATAEKGFTVNVFASADATLDGSDTLVTSLPKPTTVKAGKAVPLSIPITTLPAGLPDGTYFLIVQTVDGSNNTATIAASAPITVAAPFVALSETVTTTLPPALVSGTKAKGTVTLTITNNGNVPSKGITGINVTASTVPGVLGTSIATLPKNITIMPGKSAKVTVPIKATPALADGNYFIVTQVTDPFAGGTSIASSAGTTTIAAPFITLAATLGPVVKIKSGDTLTLTNNGNIDDNGVFTATIGFSFDSAGAQPIGRTGSAGKTFHIKAGTSIKVHSTDWAKILAGLEPGVPYFLTVSVIDATGNNAFAVSTTSFTL